MPGLRPRAATRLSKPIRFPPPPLRNVPRPAPIEPEVSTQHVPPSFKASPPPPRPGRRWPRYVAAGIVVYGASAYAAWFWFSFVTPKDHSEEAEADPKSAQDVELSAVWNEMAGRFDSEVNWQERTSLLWYLRRKLVKEAHGHVLEVSAGTGRNFKYYDLDKCKSITFLDQSAPMLQIAKKKWLEQHPVSRFQNLAPEKTKVAFRHQSAMDPLEKPKEGYDTIIQTMGVCSTPDPEKILARLGTLLNQDTGRILLIEHGRGFYDWINNVLDRDAHRHAIKFGCYNNRDIAKVLDDSGLAVEKMVRPFWFNLGTVWVIEARAPGWKAKEVAKPR